MTCKICTNSTAKVFETTVLNKYTVSYFECTACGFMQTEQPYWLNEAYSSAISNIDIGLLSRNMYIQPILLNIINSFFDNSGSFVDYGGGYGVLVRMMRDAGYDFYRQDIYCDNMFADGFDVQDKPENQRYDLVTAFEVFEHLENPLAEIEKMLTYADSIFFSTELVPLAQANPSNWWYFVPETGQHIAFYSYKSLELIAQKYKLNLYSNRRNLHLLTPKKISPAKFKLLSSPRTAKLMAILSKKPKSLLPDDFDQLRSKYASESR